MKIQNLNIKISKRLQEINFYFHRSEKKVTTNLNFMFT